MEANPTKIIDYFSGFKQNLIPLYQRQYTWEKRQWDTLWEDIVAFYDQGTRNPNSTHFMGAVVTMPARSVPVGVSKFLVIDGQQRLTTIALVLCAIRDALNENEGVLRRRIQNHYLTNDGYEGLDFFKLLPTQADRPAYASLIEKAGSDLPESQFKKAYGFFRRRLKDLDGEGNLIDAKQILEIVESRLMVVMINLSDTDDPHLIFESLNFKGSPLEQADLVRNYFLMRFGATDQQAVYDGLWMPMQSRLGSNLTEFMRHFLGSEGDEVRKGDVYAAIKRHVADSDPPSVRLLMTRMQQLSILYSRIATASVQPIEELGRYFVRFSRLEFGTVYPLLLTLYEGYEDGQFTAEEFIASLRILDSFIIRRMVVGVPSNSLSGVFISFCKSKPVTETPSAWLCNALAAEIKSRRWPSDAEFSERWLRTPIYANRTLCQVVLECMEKQFGHHEAVQPADSTIEHVLPQTLTPEWETALGDDPGRIHGEWLHTIGNLTLTGYNPDLSNKPYPDKRRIYALSHFELNRYFCGCESWSSTEIQHRAKALFASALKLWPRPTMAIEEEPVVRRAGYGVFPFRLHSRCEETLGRQLFETFANSL